MSDTSPIITPTPSPAGLLQIVAAILYDAVLVFGLVFFAFTIVYVPLAMFTGATEIQTKPLYALYMLIVAVGFHLWFWTHNGQTLGMRTWRVKLVSDDMGPVTYRQAITRYLIAWLSLLAGGLGFIWILFQPDSKSWHDLVSGTRLILLEKKS